MSEKVVVVPDGAPLAQGPYSQGIKMEQFIFVSGQLPLDPQSNSLAGADIVAQTERTLKNVEAVLQSVGSILGHVVKTTVYLKNINDFQGMNQAYEKFFPFEPPARSMVEVSGLPHGALVEIEAVAYIPPLKSMSGGLL